MKQTFIYERGSEAHEFVTEAEHQERIRRENEERRRKLKKRASNNARLLRAKRGQFRLTIAAAVILFAMFGAFVMLENNITATIKNISATEQEISQLKAENSALLSKINTNANLSEVKKKAMNELGMNYAKAGQIEYYTMKEQDYMSVEDK
jgi:cell division protein FtsL